MISDFYPSIKYLRLSDSTLSLFESCDRKLEFRKFYRHGKKDESFHGEVGKAMHAGFQSWLVHRDEERAVFDMMTNYPVHLMPERGTNQKTLEACYITLQSLMQTESFAEYEIAQIKCLDGTTRPAIEVAFQIDIEGFNLSDDAGNYIPVYYIGFIDAILFSKIKHTYGVFDVKSHRDNSDDLTAKYYFSNQVLPYGITLENILGKEIESFDVSYISCFIDIEKPQTRIYSFPKTKNDIEDWGQNLMVQLQRIKLHANTGWWPRKPNSCMAFRHPCEFFDICGNRNHKIVERMLLLDQEPVPQNEDSFKPWVRFPLRLMT